MSDPQSFWAELKQRKVVRSAGLYLAIAWGAVTVTGELTDILGLGEWLPRLVLLVTASGLPLVLVLAWVYEWKRGEIKRAVPVVGGRPWAKRLIVGVILASGPALGLGVWWLWPSDTTSSQGEELRIVVLPFSVRGSEEFAYLGNGMADLLSTKLDGAGGLMTVDPRAVVRQIEGEGETLDPSHAAEVAARLSARWFVLGSVVEAGGRLQVAASLFERGEPEQALGHGQVEGPAEQLFGLVDGVVSELLIGLSGGPEAQVQRVAGVTTSSLPAFKAYMDGEHAYRSGQYAAALGHFQRAVAIDSTFALAYFRISTAAEWAWVEELIYAGADRAVALADRLPARERRLVEVLGVRRRETNEAAEEVLRSFVGAYPDDLEAWVNLGELVTHTRPMHGRSSLEGREVWERVLALDSAHAGALLHSMRLDAYEGKLEEMDARLRMFHALNPQADRSIEMDVLAVAAHGEPTAEADMLETLASASDVDRAIGVWNASVYARNLDFAAKICELMVAPGQSVELRRAGSLWLASLQYARGRWEDAKNALEALAAVDALAAAEFRAVLLALPLAPATGDELAAAFEELHAQRVPEGKGGPQLILDLHDGLHEMIRAYALALLGVQRGDISTAAAYADSLEAMSLAADEEHVSQDLALATRARISLREADPESAVELLEQMRLSAWHGQSLFSPFYARTAERFLRGEALHRIGRNDEALSWLAHIAENSPFEVAFLPASILARAEIQSSLGETAEAVRLYGQFLDMWKGGDPVFDPVVRGAQAKLAALRND